MDDIGWATVLREVADSHPDLKTGLHGAADHFERMETEIAHLRAALDRVATPEAFYVATSDIDPEAYARMIFANMILAGATCEVAERGAEAKVRERFDKSATR